MEMYLLSVLDVNQWPGKLMRRDGRTCCDSITVTASQKTLMLSTRSENLNLMPGDTLTSSCKGSGKKVLWSDHGMKKSDS